MKQFILAVTAGTDGKSATVYLSDSLVGLPTTWLPATRISPIWLPEKHKTAIGGLTALRKFKGRYHLAFISNASPQEITQYLPKFGESWLTVGFFNVILRAKDAAAAKAAVQWATSSGKKVERWEIVDGSVRVRAVSKNSPCLSAAVLIKQTGETLEKIASAEVTPILRDAQTEFVALASSAIRRAEQSWPEALPLIAKHVDRTFADITRAAGGRAEAFRAVSQLTVTNAALSRLTSQAFSGTPSILLTECHWWIHSLVGAGTAIKGLTALVDDLSERLYRQRLGARLACLASVAWNGETLSDTSLGSPALKELAIDSSAVERELARRGEPEPREPLLAFFSGRDGFHGTPLSVSVPLAALSCCNSSQWTLRTLTHELSHPVVRNMLTILGPRMDIADETERLAEFARVAEAPARDALCLARQALFGGMFAIAVGDKVGFLTSHDGTPRKASPALVAALCDHCMAEVEELLVHMFDYQYFYGGKIESYVKGIWLSWTTVPDLPKHLDEYFIRTACVISLGLIGDGGEWASAAIKKLREYLGQIHLPDITDEVIRKAAETLLADHERIEGKLRHRATIIRLAKAFLHASSLEARIMRDGATPSTATGSFDKNPWGLDLGTVTNPIRYVEDHSARQYSDSSESIGIWFSLASSVPAQGD